MFPLLWLCFAQEKAEEIRKEKERRERGQKIDETLEERQRLQRKRDAEKQKREKDVSASPVSHVLYCMLYIVDAVLSECVRLLYPQAESSGSIVE